MILELRRRSGTRLDAFPSEKHFANWLGLCPTNETSGGKVLRRRTPKVVHRAKVAFRQAASTLLKSKSYLGAQYHRLRTRLGTPKAITAMARKLACLFYRLLTKGQQYVDKALPTTSLATASSRFDLSCAKQVKVLPSEGEAT